MKLSRRGFIGRTAAASLAGAAAVAARAHAATVPEAAYSPAPTMQPPLRPASGPDYRPVTTLNGWSLPFRMNGGWTEFHLVAEPVERELAPGLTGRLWGYIVASPGPTIDAV